MCASYLNPEVSEFLKEAIDRLNTHPKEVSEAATILIGRHSCRYSGYSSQF